MHSIHIKYILSFIIIFFIAACDKDFESINTNPASANDIPPEFLFTNALLSGALNSNQAGGATLSYAACFIQHLASTKFNWQGDKYYNDPFHGNALFNDAYRNEVKTLTELLRMLDKMPEKQNLQAMARIWRTVVFHRLTDFYGDLPYSEAGLAFAEKIYEPIYDTQQNIYEDMLQELEAACAALDGSKSTPAQADILYNGDVEKWRKFGYSMMLRLAMRLTKVDNDMAAIWSKKALTGGIMTDDNYSALVSRATGPADINKNGISHFLSIEDQGRICKTFVDWLQNHNDPRLDVYAWQKLGNDWLGLPNGIDDLHIIEFVGGNDLDSFTRINPLLLNLDAPSIIMSAAEPQLLAAEAALRGWSQEDPTVHYESAIRASMKMWGRFDGSLSIGDQAIDEYLINNPLPANSDNAIPFIQEQYWAATFLNELETYANWRRTGYPELIPVNFPGNATGGTIPRRLRYPQVEYSVNNANISEAIDRQGPDEMRTRVWWDQ